MHCILMTLKMTKKSLTSPCRQSATALAAALLLSACFQALASSLDGAHFDDTVRLGASELQLNGMGQRRMLFVKVYAAGLYLSRKAATLEAMVAQAGAKRLQLRMLHAATPDDFIGALLPGMRDNTSEAEQARLASRNQAVGGDDTRHRQNGARRRD